MQLLIATVCMAASLHCDGEFPTMGRAGKLGDRRNIMPHPLHNCVAQ